MNIMMAIIGAVAFLVFAPLIGGLLMGCDRVFTARMQSRVGPPILQPFYDVVKLWHKEKAFSSPVETIFTTAYLVLVAFSGAMLATGGNILLVVFSLTLAHTFLILAAYSANAPFSHIGAERELISVMIMEPALILYAAGIFMVTGSFMLIDVFRMGVPVIVYMPGIFLMMFSILLLRLRKSPFDISTSEHAHQELVKGVTSSLSGKNLAKVEIAHWYEAMILIALMILLFSQVYIAAVLMVLVVFFLVLIIDNVFPRVTWQMTVKRIWVTTFILGVVNIIILGIFGGVLL
jgi:ech hydrogenase subunit B